MGEINIKTYAFIFARGGSKGLPKKNLKELNGKPLIQYSIDIAKQLDCIDDIFVSTDCDEISKFAKSCNVKAIKRPDDLASDESPEWLSWQHAIKYISDRYGEFDTFVSLPATSPLRIAEDVQLAINKIKNNLVDICISITPSNHSPYFNMVELSNDQSVKIILDSDRLINRRQDSPFVYNITTVVYAAKVAFIKHNNSIFSGRVSAIIIPKERAIDIDDIYDFKFAEAIINT